MSYERKFCGLSEYVQVHKVRPLTKSSDLSELNSTILAYAHMKSNFKFRGCLRPLWPQKSRISFFSFKYRIAMIFLISQIVLRDLNSYLVVASFFFFFHQS